MDFPYFGSFLDLINWKYSKKWNTIGFKGLGIVEILEINDFKDLECNTLANNTKQPSRKSLNQTIKLDSHPGSHSIKQVNETAIPEVTQSNRSKNHGGRQADFKGGLGGAAAHPGRANDGDDDDDGFPRTLSIWSDPGSITPRNQISRAGNPSFRQEEAHVFCVFPIFPGEEDNSV